MESGLSAIFFFFLSGSEDVGQESCYVSDELEKRAIPLLVWLLQTQAQEHRVCLEFAHA